MARHKALIFNDAGVTRCQSPDFISLEHLNVGVLNIVSIDDGTIVPVSSHTGALPGTIPPTNLIHTISGGTEGSILVLRCLATTLQNNIGNLRLQGDFTMNNPNDTLTLLKTAQGIWLKLSRSNNG